MDLTPRELNGLFIKCARNSHTRVFEGRVEAKAVYDDSSSRINELENELRQVKLLRREVKIHKLRKSVEFATIC